MSLEGPKKSGLKKEGAKSSIRDVVGATPELKEEVMRSTEEIFDIQEFNNLARGEREKTNEDIEMIAIANAVTNLLRRKFGLVDFDIPAKNVHIVPIVSWTRGWGSLGGYSSLSQGIVVRDDGDSRLFTLSNIIHEVIHFKAYNALQIKLGGGKEAKENPYSKPELRDYRGGFEIISRDGEEIYFTELNEAITEELNKTLLRILVPKLRSNPIFKDEMNRTEEVVGLYSKALYKDKTPFFDSDTIQAEVADSAGTKIPDELIAKLMHSPGVKGKLEFSKISITYKEQRKMLNSLIDKVWKAHQDEFKDWEDVFDVFVAAYMTGNMLRMGRLIEETFGKGSFRKIGELDMGAKKARAEKKPAK